MRKNNTNKSNAKAVASKSVGEVNPYELKTSPKQLIKQIKMSTSLEGEQKKVAQSFHKNSFTFVFGEMGSGKTFSAVHTALNHLVNGDCKEIWITRPIVPNNLGILPGGIDEKLDPYVFPMVQNLNICIGVDLTKRLMEIGVIKIMPIDVAKGCTFNDSVVIFDEFQDTNYEDFRTLITRLGKTSKMILCGSKEQISRKINKYSCIHVALKIENQEGVGSITLTNNHRNPALTTLLPILDMENDKYLSGIRKESDEKPKSDRYPRILLD